MLRRLLSRGSARGRGTPSLVPAEGESDREFVTRLAQHHLPPEVAATWCGLLRPALLLVPARPGHEMVARLGGLPRLPAGWPWPLQGRSIPLVYVGELLCEPLSRVELEVALPRSGRLLFFYGDAGRVLHVPDEASVDELHAPPHMKPFAESRLTARSIVTAPDDVSPWFQAPGERRRDYLKEHPVNDDAFNEAFLDRHPAPRHQVGGYAAAVQGGVEVEIAHRALGMDVRYDDDQVAAESAGWRLILQIDSDRSLGMMWGDLGTLYWMARIEDLAAGDLSRVAFTEQSG